MNYLAHIYLSGNNEKLMVGNFIADAVKGNKYLSYETEIQKGILLHRQIDFITDRHPIVNQTFQYFAPVYGKYASVICDMVFDHFLAANWNQYHHQSLKIFVDHINKIFLRYFIVLPLKMKIILPFWVKNRWPELYSTTEGLQKALSGMSRYTSLPGKSEEAVEVLLRNYNRLEFLFKAFFADLERQLIIE